MRYSELRSKPFLGEDTTKYPLKAKYDQFNQKFFNGELPDIPLSFANLKHLGGRVVYKVQFRKGDTPEERRDIATQRFLGKKYYGAVVVPDTMKLQISTKYVRSEAQLDAIMIHEMIHVALAVSGNLAAQHGPEFVAIAKRIGAQAGFEIPLEDEVSELDLTDQRAKPYLVIIVKRPHGYSFAVLTPSLMTKAKEIQETLSRHIRSGYCSGAQLYTVTSQRWSNLAQKIVVQRSLKSLKYMKFHAELDVRGLIEDLRNDGKRLLDLGTM